MKKLYVRISKMKIFNLKFINQLSVVITIIISASVTSYGQSYVTSQSTGTMYPFDLFENNTTIIFEAPSASGASVPDNLSSWQNLPFAWNFYGFPVTGYYVSTNGYVTFDSAADSSHADNTLVPNIASPLSAIYALWDDLEVMEGSGATDYVKSWTYGDAPNRVHVIDFHSISPGDTAATNGTYAYAVIRIYECGDFDVVHNYANLTGLTATVGCQDSTGTDGTMVGASPSYDYPTGLVTTDSDDRVYSFYYLSQPDYNMSVLSETSSASGTYADGSSNSLTGALLNLGAQTVTSFKLNYSVDGATTQVDAISGVSISSGSYYTYTHNIAFSPPSPGVFHSIQVWASDINGANNDELPCNDTTTFNVFINAGISGSRTVLIEEYTGAWCGYCPDGHIIVDDIMASNSTVVAVMMHTGDDMETQETLDLDELFDVTGYPGAMIDRTLFSDESKIPHSRTGGAWVDHTAARINAYTPVNVSVNSTYDSNTREISATVTADFVDYAGGDMRIHLFVIENNVTGSGGGYDQSNYYSSQSSAAGGTTHPLYNEDNPIVGYIHNEVFRSAPAGIMGTSGVISAIASPGDSFSETYSYSIPTGYDEYNIELIGFVAYWDSTQLGAKEVMNAAKVDIIESGIADNINDTPFLVYPNPISSLGMVQFTLDQQSSVTASLFDVYGKQIMVMKNGELSTGKHQIAISAANLSNGVYFVQLEIDNQKEVRRIVVAH